MNPMLHRLRDFCVSACAVPLLATALSAEPACAENPTKTKLRADAQAALTSLYRQMPSARALGKNASAVLVFPNIIKVGFVVGGQYGEGVLVKRGKAAGYYNTVQGSVGYQAGAKTFGYALFLMTPRAVEYLDRSDGWELGVAPEIVIMDVGVAASLSTTTGRKDVYAFFFDQEGFMAGVSMQGTKVTRIAK